MLTTLLGMHTMARRHCEAARRQQARVTAGGPSFDRTRAGAEKFGPNQPPHRLHAPARSPQAQGGARRGPALAVFIPLPKLAVCHTQYNSCEKCEKCVSQRIEPTASCTKSVRSTYWTKTILDTRKLSGNDFERVRNETHVPRHVPRYPGYCEYSEYPPIRGSKSPRPAGALASLGGSSATRPIWAEQLAAGLRTSG